MLRLVFFTVCFLSCAQAIIAQEHKRIASAGGDLTEILFEFGVGERVIGVDSTSIYPPQVKALEQIGYVRGLSAEGVLAIAPDLLVGSSDMGPPVVMDNLQAAGLEIAYAPEGQGAERYVQKVRFIGGLLDMPVRAEELIATYRDALAEIATRREKLAQSPRVLLVLSVRDGAPIVAGKGTTGHDIITLSGGQNVADFEGWKPMNSEAIIAAQPQLIVMSDAHMERLGGHDVVMSRPDIATTPAGRNNAYISLNAQLMLQFGPRSPQAMHALLSQFETLIQ